MQRQSGCRRLALFIGLLLLLSILLTAALTSGHALHSCMKDCCKICLTIHTLQSLLRVLAALAALFILVLGMRVFSHAVTDPRPNRKLFTLITQKVRMNP